MKKLSLLALIEVSFFAAFALILDLLPSFKPIPNMSISFAMIPIFILAFRWGFRASLVAGLLWGLLQIVFDAWIVHPVQAVFDYLFAFTFIGFAGLLYNPIQKELRSKNKKKALAFVVAAIFIGSVARYFWHFLSGVIFIKYFAPEVTSPIFYSFAINGTTMLGAFIVCSIILVLILASAPQLVIRKDHLSAMSGKKAS
ncbi:energy-coupled thiamine transporter ThiT [Bacillus sp. Bva_UNVM-123]|uniref:energy-coupled thiamine transporter ThiT n=1 Tax=Bacillus sp. Bva_UNVM-123 TaxID=2829798 RepID=UPI00391F55F1